MHPVTLLYVADVGHSPGILPGSVYTQLVRWNGLPLMCGKFILAKFIVIG